MRVLAVYFFVTFCSLFAYRDWFKALCGLILLMAVIEHPDMPKSVLGIQGLNPWNLLLLNIVIGWLIQRRREGSYWDMPRHISVFLILYLLVVSSGFIRMMGDRSGLEEYPFGYLVGEHLINAVKWVIPGLLVFDGCRTKKRLYWILAATLTVYLLLALQVARWVPFSAALSGELLTARSRKLILNEIGYHAVNMSMLLAGACWAFIALLPLFQSWKYRAGIILAALCTAYGQALTAGRMGYATWCATGLILCLLRWRRWLWLVPVGLLIVVLVMPGVVERFTHGFDTATVGGDAVTDDTLVTSGRTVAWPYVVDKILESPLIGYGQMAMVRTGISSHLLEELNESFPHPHNAYLQWLLDNGLVGFFCVMPFYVLMLYYAVGLFRDRVNAINAAVGGVALSLLLALLIASMGSQTFYPREGAVGMWIAFALVLRIVAWRRTAPLPLARNMVARAAPRRAAPDPTMLPEAYRAH